MSQLQMLLEIQDSGSNIVACANCNGIYIHKMGQDYVTCPHCEREYEIHDCSDLFYPGWNQKGED